MDSWLDEWTATERREHTELFRMALAEVLPDNRIRTDERDGRSRGPFTLYPMTVLLRAFNLVSVKLGWPEITLEEAFYRFERENRGLRHPDDPAA